MTAKEKYEVMLHHEAGGEVEYKHKSEQIWSSVITPLWNWTNCEYRIKGDPKFFREGELVEVSNDGELWRKRTFIYSSGPLNICVNSNYEDEYKRGDYFNISSWRHIRKLPKTHEVTIDGEKLELSGESLKSLKDWVRRQG